MEKESKQYTFGSLIKHILNSLKLIESEKNQLINKYKDFNLMDAFRAFDLDGKGHISTLELTSGLMDMNIQPDQKGVQAFFKQFDDDNDK